MLDAKALHLAEKKKSASFKKKTSHLKSPEVTCCVLSLFCTFDCGIVAVLTMCVKMFCDEAMCISCMAQAVDSGRQALQLWTALRVSWQHKLFTLRDGYSFKDSQHLWGDRTEPPERPPLTKCGFAIASEMPIWALHAHLSLFAAVHTSWIVSDTKLFKSNLDSGTCVPSFRPFRIAGD